ncbi:MAG TPA: hypothetical protein VLE93_02125 [Candidatus Saccharimonadales bacterium]|nr:hypothetical protein [Candidatus Saccharimonadales bacterium]
MEHLRKIGANAEVYEDLGNLILTVRSMRETFSVSLPKSLAGELRQIRHVNPKEFDNIMASLANLYENFHLVAIMTFGLSKTKPEVMNELRALIWNFGNKVSDKIEG